MALDGIPKMKIVHGDAGYVLEDVPHLTDFIPDLPVSLGFCLVLEHLIRVSCEGFDCWFVNFFF